MAAGPAADVLSWTPPPLPDPDGYGGLVLLDRWCYIADLTNATTAEGTTSGGLPIQVTFRVARPPLLSHFCIHCPGLDFTRADTKVVATDADLVLLCVPIRRPFCHWDYFVYRPLVRQLDLLPSPNRSFVDIATALLRLKGGSYAVASLVPRGPVCAGGVLIRREFDLHLYRSSSNNPDDKEEGLWITKRLSLNEFVRERVTPMPASREFGRMYHETDKTIAVSGSGEEGGGTVAWVDLWRGIFLCDVLKECPVLQDIPLPAPARGNWNSVLRYDDPRYFRDVTISRNRDSIKYVEMESCSPTELEDAIPVSYTEWMRKSPWKLQVTRDGWKATTWSIAIPVDSSSVDCWYRESQVHAKDITLDDSDPCIYELQSMLGCVGDAMKLWKELLMVYPSVSIDDNVVYLLTRTRPMDKLDMVFAIDLGKRVLRGVAKLDVQKNFIYRPICTSEILRFQRNTITGTTEEIGRTETKPLSQLQKKRVLRRARRTGKH